MFGRFTDRRLSGSDLLSPLQSDTSARKAGHTLRRVSPARSFSVFGLIAEVFGVDGHEVGGGFAAVVGKVDFVPLLPVELGWGVGHQSFVGFGEFFVAAFFYHGNFAGFCGVAVEVVDTFQDIVAAGGFDDVAYLIVFQREGCFFVGCFFFTTA